MDPTLRIAGDDEQPESGQAVRKLWCAVSGSDQAALTGVPDAWRGDAVRAEERGRLQQNSDIALFPFQFWEGDEEFAPKIMILWYKKALDFMHFETLYYVIGLLLQRLAELCDKN